MDRPTTTRANLALMTAAMAWWNALSPTVKAELRAADPGKLVAADQITRYWAANIQGK